MDKRMEQQLKFIFESNTNYLSSEKLKATDSPSYGKSTPISFKEFRKLKGIDRRALLGNLFTTGDIIEIAAPGGTGKSFWIYKSAIAMAIGGKFFGYSCPYEHKVLLLDGELPIDDVNERFDNMFKTMSENDVNKVGNNLNIINRELAGGMTPNLCLLREQDPLFEEMLKHDVIIIDSLKTNSFGSNISNADDVAELLKLMLKLKSHGKTVIYINHFTKATTNSGSLGSVDFSIINDVKVEITVPPKGREGLRAFNIVKGRRLSDKEKEPRYFIIYPDRDGTPIELVAA
jgi:RecA-family ATPase